MTSTPLGTALELAGMTSDEGQLERPLSDDTWPIPGVVELDGDRLHYQWGALERSVSSGPALLLDFVRLVDAPDEAILAYGRSWGVLELCGHELPAIHGRPALAPSGMHRMSWCEPLGFDPAKPRREQVYWEPLDAWRRWSGQASALVTLTAQLRTGAPTRPEDWRLALDHDRRPGLTLLGHCGGAWTGDEWHIARRVNDWLAISASRLSFDWGTGRPATVTVGGGRLFGAIAAQLMFAVSRSEGLAICSGCAAPYFPTRKPAAGRRRYCPECQRAGVPLRDAKRASRATQSRYHLEGS